ncbi:Receptor y region, transmembrane domain- and RING domain-containing 3 [Lecanosticta acicola]|uniref:RING-type E3 ubiquitin transferase n=1 Tax=Lecanosticta acicola TaxID=111012 RepID=A0AAI8YSI8_9PEZI|nr:Receptor y region, transmembrane domain- and RING domain-containing 3 [Lecanosticta acicola]
MVWMHRFTRRLCLVLAFAVFPAAAQTIQATNTVAPAVVKNDHNATSTSSPSASWELAIGQGGANTPSARYPLYSLGTSTTQASTSILSGPILLANASSQLAIAPSNIVLISCDPYTGNIQPSDVFSQATQRNATGIVLYSTQEAGCALSGADEATSERVYTLTTASDGKIMLDVTNSLGSAYAMLGTRDELGNSTGTQTSSAPGASSTASQQPQNPLGPSPSTAVAMIILYSITGIITALFLAIIITGAVRAHRHPERYGPRNGVGRPRQSRARGLAMAMLETIPIVKFRDGEQDRQPKPTETELEEGRTQQQRETAQQHETTIPSTDGTREQPDTAINGPSEEAGTSSSGGIAAATERPNAESSKAENPGCSICTEDFQPGEDQRVLPCDHRFHPACVDPWLLNVSGTCPLCRIDLRPADEQGGEDGESSQDFPPPLGGRMGVRRSLIIGLLGSRVPERMTREERVRALREYRDQQRGSQGESEGAQQPEGEAGVRQRLRNALRIRTRRTGEHEGNPNPNPQQQQPQQQEDSSATTIRTPNANENENSG